MPRLGHGTEESRSGQSVPRLFRAQRPSRQPGRVHRLVRQTNGFGDQQEYAHFRVVSGRPQAQHVHHAADAHHQRVRSAVATPGGHGDAQLETGSDQVVVDEGEPFASVGSCKTVPTLCTCHAINRRQFFFVTGQFKKKKKMFSLFGRLYQIHLMCFIYTRANLFSDFERIILFCVRNTYSDKRIEKKSIRNTSKNVFQSFFNLLTVSYWYIRFSHTVCLNFKLFIFKHRYKKIETTCVSHAFK